MPRLVSFAARLVLFLICFAPAKPPDAAPASGGDYENGIAFATDGGVSGGPCFRLHGRLTSPDFFAGLKRTRSASGAEFRRGTEKVTHFPAEMQLRFTLRDFPCPENIRHGGARKYLTREWMSGLKFAFYWKRGMALRPATNVSDKTLTVERAEPYDALSAQSLPERLLWRFHSVVASAGVPLTDHLVIVLHTPDHRAVARVSARM